MKYSSATYVTPFAAFSRGKYFNVEYFRRVAGIIILFWLAGCTTPQTQHLLRQNSNNLPPRIELADVSFYPQETHQCGPASLAMVMNAGGAKVTPQDLIPQVYNPGREGSFQVEMLAAARRNNMLAYQLAPRLEDLLGEVAAGSPVLVLQNLGLSWYPVWHYAVVVGYDLQHGEIVLRSGRERRLVMPLSTFEHTWKRSGYWAMLALLPDKMPHTVVESTYMTAAMALERSGSPLGAETAYQSALKRWPLNLAARIGVGNIAYAMNDYALAESAYRQATLDHPESSIAFNNLAQVMADQQHYEEALVAARHAVSLGGNEVAAAQETLKQIMLTAGEFSDSFSIEAADPHSLNR